jgi:DNA-directed RNA polymerase specialized sigma24 family protein
MTGEQRAAIQAGYLNGLTVPEIAAAARAPADEVETYLAWWCDRGCPGAVTDA